MSDNTIKFAQPEDVPQIVTLSYKSFYENELDKFNACPPDFDKTLISLTDIVLDHPCFVKRNDEDSVCIDGVLAFKQDSLWWSSEEILHGVIFYIKPEVRSFKLAKNLLSAAKEYAIMNRISIVLDLFAQKDVDRKRKLLLYMGFKECGSYFIFNGDV